MLTPADALQRLIDRATARATTAVRADGSTYAAPPPAVLELESPPWQGVQLPGGPAPYEPAPAPPSAPNPWVTTIEEQAAALFTAHLATVPAHLLEAARAAGAEVQRISRELNAAERERAALAAPAPAGATLDERAAHLGRRAALEEHTGVLARELAAANARHEAALREARWEARYSVAGIEATRAAERHVRALREQAEALQKQADQADAALRLAHGRVERYIP